MKTVELLEEALREIENLRAGIRSMSGKLEVFESMMNLFNARPQGNKIGGSPDVAARLRRVIAEEEFKKETESLIERSDRGNVMVDQSNGDSEFTIDPED